MMPPSSSCPFQGYTCHCILLDIIHNTARFDDTFSSLEFQEILYHSMSQEQYPDYYDIIRYPIDLQAMLAKAASNVRIDHYLFSSIVSVIGLDLATCFSLSCCLAVQRHNSNTNQALSSFATCGSLLSTPCSTTVLTHGSMPPH
jgi:hypothetical protein